MSRIDEALAAELRAALKEKEAVRALRKENEFLVWQHAILEVLYGAPHRHLERN